MDPGLSDYNVKNTMLHSLVAVRPTYDPLRDASWETGLTGCTDGTSKLCVLRAEYTFICYKANPSPFGLNVGPPTRVYLVGTGGHRI